MTIIQILQLLRSLEQALIGKAHVGLIGSSPPRGFFEEHGFRFLGVTNYGGHDPDRYLKVCEVGNRKVDVFYMRDFFNVEEKAKRKEQHLNVPLRDDDVFLDDDGLF